jgi:hypothetical protein
VKYQVLHLNGSKVTEFYNVKRSEYGNVDAKSIFKENNLISKIFRRVFNKILPVICVQQFGDWKREIENYSLIIISASIYNKTICNYIRKKTKARIIIWYWNPVDKFTDPRKTNVTNCEFWSFDKNDCKKYNLNYISTYYFSNIHINNTIVENDVYFVGADKGRLQDLLQLERLLNSNGVTTRFHITSSKIKSNLKNYTYSKYITYDEVLECIFKSRVILDYVQEGQSGMTQRPMESIFLRKKLITNDKNISQYDFYNEKNIFILGVDDISNIKKFIQEPYEDISEEILMQYDFGRWINILLKH